MNDILTNIIYKFLDVYFGDEVYVKQQYYMLKPEYVIYSKKGGVILSFIVHDNNNDLNVERISLITGYRTCQMLCGFFSIERKEAGKYLRDWFGDKHNLKKVGDIKKFIP